MNKEQIAAAWALVNAAIEGPWHVEDDWNVHCARYSVMHGSIYVEDDAESTANAAFIAAARALVPALLAERDDLWAKLGEAQAERERLALAICGGEDAPGYANAQAVETLEKVARDNAAATMQQINRTLAVEAKLDAAVEAVIALLTVMDMGDKPIKLDPVLTWRQCDEKARAMAMAVVADRAPIAKIKGDAP